MTITVRVLYFAALREDIGFAEETVTLTEAASSPLTVASLLAILRARGGVWEQAFAAHHGVLKCAVNQAFASSRTLLPENAEVAFFPPVTGG